MPLFEGHQNVSIFQPERSKQNMQYKDFLIIHGHLLLHCVLTFGVLIQWTEISELKFVCPLFFNLKVRNGIVTSLSCLDMFDCISLHFFTTKGRNQYFVNLVVFRNVAPPPSFTQFACYTHIFFTLFDEQKSHKRDILIGFN